MDNFTTSVEASRVHVLTSKLKNHYKAYRVGTEKYNRLAQGAALSAIMEECRSKEPLCEVARQFVKDQLKMNYTDLLTMKRRRYI